MSQAGGIQGSERIKLVTSGAPHSLPLSSPTLSINVIMMCIIICLMWCLSPQSKSLVYPVSTVPLASMCLAHSQCFVLNES